MITAIPVQPPPAAPQGALQGLPCAQQGLAPLPLTGRQPDRPLHHLPLAHIFGWWRAHWPCQVAGQGQYPWQAVCVQMAPQAVALGPPAPVQHRGMGASWQLGWPPLWLPIGQQVVLPLVGSLQQAQQCVDWCHWKPLSKTSDGNRTKIYSDDMQGNMRHCVHT